MQKMGYIFGTGLGKNAEGRIDPVTAVILPRGKSLGKHRIIILANGLQKYYILSGHPLKNYTGFKSDEQADHSIKSLQPIQQSEDILLKTKI